MMNFQVQPLLIASRNPGKVKELRELFKAYGITIQSALDFDIEEPPETGVTLKDNARLKAIYYGSRTNMACIADDSGLVIEALDGWPGVHTKNFANPKDDYALIRNKLGDHPSQARMVCTLCLRTTQGDLYDFEGSVAGQLVFPPRGQGGFGVDPIFQPIAQPGQPFYTFAEKPELKKELSHRSMAFAHLLKALFPHAP